MSALPYVPPCPACDQGVCDDATACERYLEHMEEDRRERDERDAYESAMERRAEEQLERGREEGWW